MRVAVVTTSFPKSVDDAAGHFVQASARALAQQGHDVHVIAAGQARGRAPEHRGELTIHWAGGGSLFGWPGAAVRLRRAPWRLPAAARFLVDGRRRLGRLGKVDRAIAHWIVPCAWPLLAGTHMPLEAVAHGGDVRLLMALPSAARLHILQALLRRGTQFQFVSGAAREELLAALPADLARRLDQTSRVRPAHLDLPSTESLRRTATATRLDLGLSGGEALLVFLGRLVPSKRVDMALEAAARLDRPVHVAVVGSGPEAESLQTLSHELELPATFTGKLPRPEALRFVAAADVLIHPSLREGAPTAVREARALGVPVVAFPAGDIARWAQSDPGIWTASATANGLAAALERALPQG